MKQVRLILSFITVGWLAVSFGAISSACGWLADGFAVWALKIAGVKLER